MKMIPLLLLPAIALCCLQACDEKERNTPTGSPAIPEGTAATPINSVNLEKYNSVNGYWENGTLITEYNCPDSKFFDPIDLKTWDKTPAVNGRLPTFAETMNSTAILHYGEKTTENIKPYPMTLPKLAYYADGPTKLVFDPETRKEVPRPEPVVVIQIVQAGTDTVVSYRYLTGGCGGSKFYKFHFLTDEEVKQVTEKKL